MSKEYDDYLQLHKNNVRAAYLWIKDNLPGLLMGSEAYEDRILFGHDESKSYPEIYEYYDRYFYNNDNSEELKKGFDMAWLKHIHTSPHHWQYWILYNDEANEGMVALEMDYGYIIEMICDWWSFGFRDNKLLELFDYYNKNKDYMIFGAHTRTIVEYTLQTIHQKVVDNKLEDI